MRLAVVMAAATAAASNAGCCCEERRRFRAREGRALPGSRSAKGVFLAARAGAVAASSTPGTRAVFAGVLATALASGRAASCGCVSTAVAFRAAAAWGCIGGCPSATGSPSPTAVEAAATVAALGDTSALPAAIRPPRLGKAHSLPAAAMPPATAAHRELTRTLWTAALTAADAPTLAGDAAPASDFSAGRPLDSARALALGCSCALRAPSSAAGDALTIASAFGTSAASATA